MILTLVAALAIAQPAEAARGATIVAPDGHAMTAAERHRCRLVGEAITATAPDQEQRFVAWGLASGARVTSLFKDSDEPTSAAELAPVKDHGLVRLWLEAKESCLADLMPPSK